MCDMYIYAHIHTLILLDKETGPGLVFTERSSQESMTEYPKFSLFIEVTDFRASTRKELLSIRKPSANLLHSISIYRHNNVK